MRVENFKPENMTDPDRLAARNRRIWKYSRRFYRTALNHHLTHKCCFMHIAKSGGTSITEALESTIAFDRRIALVDAVPTRRACALKEEGTDSENLYHEDGNNCAKLFSFRNEIVAVYMAAACDLIFGHFIFNRELYNAFGSQYKFATMMRDPVGRLISNYRSSRSIAFHTLSLDDYLQSDIARRHAWLNLRYFSGCAEPRMEDEQRLLEGAKENMEHFSIIGFLDDLPGFCADFKREFGLSLSIRKLNVGSGEVPDITSEQREKIIALCRPDIELMNYARARFSQKSVQA